MLIYPGGDQMIVKPYTQTLYMDALISLTKRLKKNHPKYNSLQDELNRNIAGDIGEETVMNFLKKVHLPYKFFAFHNVFTIRRISFSNGYPLNITVLRSNIRG